MTSINFWNLQFLFRFLISSVYSNINIFLKDYSLAAVHITQGKS